MEDKCFILRAGELELTAAELGATLLRLRFRGTDTLIGYERPEDCLTDGNYLGAAVGRVANRIAGARLTLHGQIRQLSANEGENQLHGGDINGGWSRRRWTGEQLSDSAVRFTLLSPDGDNGYPGALRASVTYTLSDRLRIDFEGISDADTVFAPTSHLYFAPGTAGDARECELWLNASCYLPVDGALLPTGELRVTAGDFDFSRLRKVGKEFDHCFVLDGERACLLRTPDWEMELHTDFPALQVYTGTFLPAPFGAFGGLALEPEFFPDSPHHPEFPSILLPAGERFHRYAEYVIR